jgi:hypothetical protein
VSLALSWILQVWYSPIKAFREITQQPDILGPIVILVIASLIGAGFQQIAQSKILVENLIPEGEEWTSSTKFWTSNGILINNTRDWLMGNQSIQSFVKNNTRIWMKLDLSKANQEINCPEEGITKLYFGLKWNHSDSIAPNSARIQLLSPNETSFFELNLTQNLQESNVWSNITLNIAKENGWLKEGAPTWERITDIKFELNWAVSNHGNLTLLIDDLALGGKFEPLTTYMFLDIFLYLISNFLIFWAIYFVVLLVFCRGLVFNFETSNKILFSTLGYTFSIKILLNILSLILILIFPTVYIPRNWYPPLIYQVVILMIFLIFPVITIIWIVHLTAIALRNFHDFSWLKALGISAVAYLSAFFLRGLIISISEI